MNTATEKQATEISQLSYKLFELKGSTDFSSLITYQHALGFTYEIAQGLLENLRTQVEKTEQDELLLSKLAYNEKIARIEHLTHVENYIKPVSIIADPATKLLSISTDTGRTISITVDVTTNRNETTSIGLQTLYNICKIAIDEDKRINLVIIGKYTVSYLENPKLENNLKTRINELNKILTAMNNLLPLRNDKTSQSKVIAFDKMLPYIKIRDQQVHDFIAYNISNPVFSQQYANLLRSAETYNYAVAHTNVPIKFL